MKKPKADSRLEIIYRNVDEIGLLEMNFKRHDLDEAEASIRLRGMIDPIGFNPNTGKTFDGNGRTETIQNMRRRWLELGANPNDVPKGISVDEDIWLVPTVDVPMTELEEQSAAAALNRIAEKGGYDEALMLEVLQNLQGENALEATGYSDDDLKDLLSRFPKEKRERTEGEDEEDSLRVELNENAPTSVIKQVQLLYAPDNHARFLAAADTAADVYGTDNLSDTVLAALEAAKERKEDEAVLSKTDFD